jgi:hypothetical protein
MRAPFNFRRLLRMGAQSSALTLVAALLAGCAHPQHTVSAARQTRAAQIPALDHIILADHQNQALYSFQKGKGKLGSARDAFLDSAKMGLSAPGAGVIATGEFLSVGSAGCTGDPEFYGMLAGAVGSVTLVGAALAGPVVGTTELIRSFKKVSPQELEQCEAALTNAMSHMAQQSSFLSALYNAGTEKNERAFQASPPHPSSPDTTPSTVLETSVDELRLERAGTSEGSFFLRIKTHVRLVGNSDPAVVYYQGTAEYRSGESLFLDWTLNGALESVAETGYQALARYYINQLTTP